jgi:DNA repair exonuclease SbcCD ATPase subunit
MAGLIFHEVTIRNFLSYGNNTTLVQLDEVGTTLIVGEDLDNTTNGQGANGVGKSSIINALAYAVYDRPVSNISKDNLVNNINKKNMEVSTNFTAINGKNYTVKRARKTKVGAAGNTVHIFEDGKDITPDSVSHANELIVKVIGIPYELFVRIVVFSASHTPFLDLPTASHYAANQKDIIEELFGLTVLTSKAELLKAMIKDTDGRLVTNQAKIATLEKEHERYKMQLDSAKKRVLNWEGSNQDTIEGLESKLEAINGVDIEGQQVLYTQAKEIKKQKNECDEQNKQVMRLVQPLRNEFAQLTQELDHLRDATCPYCKQEFVGSADKAVDLELKMRGITLTIGEHNEQLKIYNDNYIELDLEHEEIRSKITVANIEELAAIKNQSVTFADKITELKEAINPYLEPLDELMSMPVEPINYDEINKITKEADHQKFLLKLLTKKDSFVRKALLNKNIPYLNQKLTHYLTVLGLPHKVEFTHEMTASISQFGHELDFGNLSAGQRARVNLALSFAFRDVLQSIHTKINVCMLDEALDHGLDSVGVQSAVKLLKKKAREEELCMFVITHRGEVDSAFDYTLTVQLKGGFSYILQNTDD